MNPFAPILISFLLLFGTFPVYGQIDQTLVLNGFTDFIEFPENELMDFDLALSIECWIQPNCVDGNKVLVSKQRCEDDFGYVLSVNDGLLTWTFSTDGTCNALSIYQNLGYTIPTDEFTHVAVVHTQFQVKLFINGLQVSGHYTQGGFGVIANSEEPFLIGAYQEPDEEMTDFYSGQIDELRVWNIELANNLIFQQMDTPLTGNETGLVAYLNMEQNGQGSTLFLVNQSSIGGFIDASPIGFTPFSPYTIHHLDYGEGSIDLGEDINSCNPPITLSIPPGNYHSILWSTGATDNSINVLNPGNYDVRVETELCKFYMDTISVELSDFIFISSEYSLCEDDTLSLNDQLFFEAGIFQDTVFSNTSACDTIYEYLVSVIPSVTENLQVEICPFSTYSYAGQELAAGSVSTFTFANAQGCDSLVTIEVLPTLVLTENVDLVVCEGEMATFDGIALAANTSTDFIYESAEGCDSIVTVNVVNTQPFPDFLGNDTLVCGEIFELVSPNENTFWNTGEIAGSIDVNTAGIYTASFTDEMGCINSDTIDIKFVNQDIYVPNAFSPNGDGINDCFQPFYPAQSTFTDFRFSVFNRWGELVFQSNNFSDCWDGRYGGELSARGIYVWMIEGIYSACLNSSVSQGEVLLLR